MKIQELRDIIDTYHQQKGHLRKFFGFFSSHENKLSVTLGMQELIDFYNQVITTDKASNDNLSPAEEKTLKKIIVSRLERLRDSYRNPEMESKLTDKCFFELSQKLNMDVTQLFTPFSVSTDSYVEQKIEKFLFRGDDRDYQLIFKDGFSIRDKSPKESVITPFVSSNQHFICASQDFKVAPFFPANNKKTSFIYIFYLEKGFDVFEHGLKTLTADNIIEASRTGWIQEVVSKKNIPSIHILAAIEVERITGENFMGNSYYWHTFNMKKIHLNENVDLNLKEKGNPLIQKISGYLNAKEIKIPTPRGNEKEAQKFYLDVLKQNRENFLTRKM